MWQSIRDSEWSTDHVARHGVTLDEVRDVVLFRPHWVATGTRGSTLVYGRTRAGRYLFVVIVDDGLEAFVVTARDMTASERRTFVKKAR